MSEYLFLIYQKLAGAEIEGISVQDKDRKLGIGRDMILQTMEKENLKYIFARIDEEAIGFYIQCGFQIEKVIEEYLSGKITRYHCSLSK